MRIAPVLVVALLAGCASSGATSTRPASETVRIEGVGSLNVAGHQASASVATVPFAIDRVWEILPAVYDSLAIPVTRADAASHVLANDGMKVRARLGKTALSRYLDCGNTQMGPSADNYEVYLTVTTQLKSPDAKSTVVETTIDATAKPINFAQSPTRCTSKGGLEPRVSTLITVLLGLNR